ncbi:hypothetical protein L484_011632 [Morus notabilis]|uniref:Uncharacterized protein n=1 Tax=Morus notabilis TaxID=981085 RepID=W9RMZ5_9ROSA|nr:hypothetical protein L484_011632 [Morus notabilis]
MRKEVKSINKIEPEFGVALKELRSGGAEQRECSPFEENDKTSRYRFWSGAFSILFLTQFWVAARGLTT